MRTPDPKWIEEGKKEYLNLLYEISYQQHTNQWTTIVEGDDLMEGEILTYDK